MMIWDEFIKKEELESSPGVIDQDLVRALTLNTYLTYIRDMVNEGMNEYPDFVSDQLEFVMMDIYLCSTYVLEGRHPDNDEISTYLDDPGNVEARNNLAAICVNSNPDSWPEVEEQLKSMVSGGKLERINWNSEERQKNAEKWRKRFEQDGYIEL